MPNYVDLVNQTLGSQRFEIVCRECREQMLLVDGWKVCPNGCGKLIPVTLREWNWLVEQYRVIKINPRPWRPQACVR